MVMFYNVENLYDTTNDPSTDDEAFLPSARIPWTGQRLELKITHIAQVISQIAPQSFPVLVGMAEIENEGVLQMLVASKSLQTAHYQYVHYDSPDERGIDVALLYDPARFTVTASEPLRVVLPAGDRTRDILYVKGKTPDGNTLHVFVNHWPSRREGTEISEQRRLLAAGVLHAKIESIRKNQADAAILIMGDFNDEPSDKSITMGIPAYRPEENPRPGVCYNLLYNAFVAGKGSLYYKDWDLFDQIMVSGNLLTSKKNIHTSVDAAGIFSPKYLLHTDRSGKQKPNRTQGEKYFGGYSDHLPVYVNFTY